MNGTFLDVGHKNGEYASIVHDVHHSIPFSASHSKDHSGLQLNKFRRTIVPSMNGHKWILDTVLHSIE
jgi:hypothetical protein